MNGALSSTRWIDVIRREYLDTFVRDGGSTVKFAVHSEVADVTTTEIALLEAAKNAGYLSATIGAEDTRVHMPQNLFFRIANQIDWHRLAKMMMLRLCVQMKYDTTGIEPDHTRILEKVGGKAGLTAEFLEKQLRPKLQSAVFDNRNMSRDFRIAMTHLCIIAMGDAPNDSETHPIIAWLTGEQKGISGVYPYSIYTPITRTNARHFLESLFHWVRQVGYAGTAVILDDRRLMVAKNPRDGRVFYTRAMVMDHYELLREVIDSADQLDGLFMAVLTGMDFDDPHQGFRGYSIYSALQSRIANEVRDRARPNPLAAMVRIGSVDNDGAIDDS